MITSILFGLFGLSVLIFIAWLFSNNRGAVDWRLVLTGIALQIGFAALVLLVPGGRDVFNWLGDGFVDHFAATLVRRHFVQDCFFSV